ncbi:hypothetical protein FHS96_000891 [Sphingomonas zeicaulis]|uniref:hypothetical protein n=1 Tax=Sphingomonas zeicaulis TaxID=1632740 RepID=UPI003D24638F
MHRSLFVRRAILMAAAPLALTACGEGREDAAITANSAVPADVGEAEAMTNGLGGERSSGPSGIGDTSLGTTDQGLGQGAKSGNRSDTADGTAAD